MKTTMSARILAALGAGLFVGAGAAQTRGAEPSATPAVQKVSVKGTAHFDFDRTALHGDDGTQLMTKVRSMKNVTWQTISVTGHADSVGPQDYNLRLSERRARQVQTFLLDKGVKPEKIRLDAQGETAPIASNETAAGRAQNRRVEIEFVGLQSLVQ